MKIVCHTFFLYLFYNQDFTENSSFGRVYSASGRYRGDLSREVILTYLSKPYLSFGEVTRTAVLLNSLAV